MDRALIPAACVAACLLACAPARPPAPATEALVAAPHTEPAYFSEPRAGANMFSVFPSARRFRAARALGIEMVRLVPDRWQGLERDFLLGDADDYRGLVAGDLERLRRVLDEAHAAGLRIVLGMLSLPGARWRQHNDDEDDARLWQSESFERQAARFWGDLARELRGHPAIVAYNPINEPRTDDDAAIRGVYARIVAAIRSADPSVPIVLDVGRDAAPRAFVGFEPLDDPGVLYAFHFYEPWEHVTWRRNRGEVAYGGEAWSRAHLVEALASVDRWRAEHGLAPTRIFAAELGCDRRVPGVERYLDDAIGLIEERGYHWAFYAFRDDDWDGFDYELGARPLTEAEREIYARGRALDLDRPGGPAFDVLLRHLRRRPLRRFDRPGGGR
jgi:hypothetical protein